MIRIHNFARGARGVRVFWLCEEMGLPYQTATVTFPPSAEYLALNPLGSVPFLEDEGGVAINESIAMLLYLAQKYGPSPLLPGNDDPALARVLQLTVFGEASIGAGMNPLLMAKFGAPEADKRPWLVRVQESRVEQETPDLFGIAVRHHAGALCRGESEVAVREGFRFDRWDGSISWHAPGDQYLPFSEFVSFQRCASGCGDLAQCTDACAPPPPAAQQSAEAD